MGESLRGPQVAGNASEREFGIRFDTIDTIDAGTPKFVFDERTIRTVASADFWRLPSLLLLKNQRSWIPMRVRTNDRKPQLMTPPTTHRNDDDSTFSARRAARVGGSFVTFAWLFALPTAALAEPGEPAAAPAVAATETPTPSPPPAAPPQHVPEHRAQTAPRTTAAEAPPSATTDSVDASPLPNRDDAGRDLPARPGVLAPLSWDKESGQGVALGYESGLWGSRWQQGLRVGIPLQRHFALHVRAVYVSDTSVEDDVPYTADLGGRLDFIGRSPALFNVVRLYGGGGVQVFEPVFATEGRSTQIGGGGHFGFEFFCSPHYSFFLEVGGQGGRPSPGATVLAGMAFYPWTE